MSVTICWRPKSEKAKYFSGGTSTSLDKLRQAFGNAICESDIPALRAMAIAANDKFYLEVIEIVEKVGGIEVWGEH